MSLTKVIAAGAALFGATFAEEQAASTENVQANNYGKVGGSVFAFVLKLKNNP